MSKPRSVLLNTYFSYVVKALLGVLSRFGVMCQNPLAMVATLCGPEREILSVKLSPFENFLTPDGSMQWLNRLW